MSLRIVKSSVVSFEDRLTEWPLLDLLSHHSKRADQLYQYLDSYFDHSRRRFDFRIDIKSLEKVTDGLKQLYKSIVARCDVFDRLYT